MLALQRWSGWTGEAILDEGSTFNAAEKNKSDSKWKTATNHIFCERYVLFVIRHFAVC
jgi:hypothetical protein